jgi:hypothetical protein
MPLVLSAAIPWTDKMRRAKRLCCDLPDTRLLAMVQNRLIEYKVRKFLHEEHIA